MSTLNNYNTLKNPHRQNSNNNLIQNHPLLMSLLIIIGIQGQQIIFDSQYTFDFIYQLSFMNPKIETNQTKFDQFQVRAV